MDLNNYPLHLTSSELDHELNIRGLFNLTNNRVKTASLRELMLKESVGKELAPKRDLSKNIEAELSTCNDIFENVAALAKKSIETNNRGELLRCISRFIHVQSRLERLRPTDPHMIIMVNELLDFSYNAIIEVSESLYGSSSETNQNQSQLSTSTDAINNQTSQSVQTVVGNLDNTASFSAQLNALHFSNMSDCQGAVGGNTTKSPQNSMVNLNSAERILSNPFRSQLNTNSPSFTHIPNSVQQSMTRRENSKNQSEQSRTNYVNRNIAESVNAIQNETSNHRFNRSVPINQWKITFSGDEKGLHLYDFLTQLSLFQRSENVTDREMVYSIMHLLSGRARLWYFSVADQFNEWSEVVSAMKKEFLPSNYDFLLLNDITNRAQKRNETFGEFITHMQALFKCISQPLDENHKLFIVRKNLLPKYAMSIAPLNINTLEQLIDACRSIDNAASLSDNNTYSMPFSQSDSRVYSIHRQEGTIPSQNQSISPSTSRGRNRCWNCQVEGHSYGSCDQPKRGVFCFKCGARGVITSRCSRCSGNVEGNRANVGPAPGSTNN